MTKLFAEPGKVGPTLLGAISALAGGLVVATADYYYADLAKANERLAQFRTDAYLDFLELNQSVGMAQSRQASLAARCDPQCGGGLQEAVEAAAQEVTALQRKFIFNRNKVILYGSAEVVAAVADYYRYKAAAASAPASTNNRRMRDAYVQLLEAMRGDSLGTGRVAARDVLAVICPDLGGECYSVPAAEHLGLADKR